MVGFLFPVGRQPSIRLTLPVAHPCEFAGVWGTYLLSDGRTFALDKSGALTVENGAALAQSGFTHQEAGSQCA